MDLTQITTAAEFDAAEAVSMLSNDQGDVRFTLCRACLDASGSGYDSAEFPLLDTADNCVAKESGECVADSCDDCQRSYGPHASCRCDSEGGAV